MSCFNESSESRRAFLEKELERLSISLSEAGATGSITVDGVSTTFDRPGTIALIDRYQKELAAIKRSGRILKTSDISGFWR